MSDRDAVLDAAALIRAAANRDRNATRVLLDNSDNRAVAEVLARWCSGWLQDAEKLSASDFRWREQLQAWAQHASTDDSHPWEAP